MSPQPVGSDVLFRLEQSLLRDLLHYPLDTGPHSVSTRGLPPFHPTFTPHPTSSTLVYFCSPGLSNTVKGSSFHRRRAQRRPTPSHLGPLIPCTTLQIVRLIGQIQNSVSRDLPPIIIRDGVFQQPS